MRNWITARLVTFAWVYFTLLPIWLVLHIAFGDRSFATFVINSVVWYYFLPLPFVLGIAILAKRRNVWIGFACSAGLWLVLYGGLFVPPALRAPQRGNGPVLTVMTYNVLTFNQRPNGVIDAIRVADADVVALQELSPLMAEALERELSDDYPYQLLEPDEGYKGLGLLSRYPMELVEAELPELAFGRPQVVTLDFEGAPVTIFHYHAHPPTIEKVPGTNLVVSEWETQKVARFIETIDGPVILPTDLNATDQHTGYRALRHELKDAWREAGWGVGHTYPGASQDGKGTSLSILNVRIPNWLARIDYVFVSDDWRVVSAEIGPWDGASDHRPVVATLQLAEGTR